MSSDDTTLEKWKTEVAQRGYPASYIVEVFEEHRLKHSDNDVLALLWEHGARLHALLYRLTLRTHVAEDLMQDLFCNLSQSDGFRRADKPVAYAYRTAANLAFDWRRSQKPTPALESTIDDLPDPEVSALDDLAHQEELKRLLDAISSLPAQGRELLVPRYLEPARNRHFSTNLLDQSCDEPADPQRAYLQQHRPDDVESPTLAGARHRFQRSA